MSDDTPTQRFDAAGDEPTRRMDAAAGDAPTERFEPVTTPPAAEPEASAASTSRRTIIILSAVGAALLIALVVLVVVLLTRGAAPAPASTSTPSPTATESATPTPTPTPTESATPTPTPTPTATSAAPPAPKGPTFATFSAPTSAGCGAGDDFKPLTFTWSSTDAVRAYIGVATANAKQGPYESDLPPTATYTNLAYQCNVDKQIYTVTLEDATGQLTNRTVTITK